MNWEPLVNFINKNRFRVVNNQLQNKTLKLWEAEINWYISTCIMYMSNSCISYIIIGGFTMLHSRQALLHNMYFCTFVCFRCFCMCTVQYLTNKIIIYLNTNFTLNIHILCTFVLLILWTIGHKKYEGSFWVWHHENLYPLSLSFFASEVGRGDDPWH